MNDPQTHNPNNITTALSPSALIPEQISPAAGSEAHLENTPNGNDENWLARNRTKLGVAAFALGGAMLLTHPSDMAKTKTEIEHNAHIAYEVFPITEGAAWLGAGLMLASAGRKVGNPLTIKKRLTEVKTELNDNRMYRAGWALGALGAVGTSATVAVGAVVALPESTWPLAGALSATSIAVSTIPFKPSKRANKGSK